VLATFDPSASSDDNEWEWSKVAQSAIPVAPINRSICQMPFFTVLKCLLLADIPFLLVILLFWTP
jgi:hypothetical protein